MWANQCCKSYQGWSSLAPINMVMTWGGFIISFTTITRSEHSCGMSWLFHVAFTLSGRGPLIRKSYHWTRHLLDFHPFPLRFVTTAQGFLVTLKASRGYRWNTATYLFHLMCQKISTCCFELPGRICPSVGIILFPSTVAKMSNHHGDTMVAAQMPRCPFPGQRSLRERTLSGQNTFKTSFHVSVTSKLNSSYLVLLSVLTSSEWVVFLKKANLHGHNATSISHEHPGGYFHQKCTSFFGTRRDLSLNFLQYGAPRLAKLVYNYNNHSVLYL